MDDLLQWASPRQAEFIEAVKCNGTAYKAAQQLGVSHGTIKSALKRVREKAARQGHSPEHDMTHGTPDGFHVKGVSTLYGPTGDVLPCA